MKKRIILGQEAFAAITAVEGLALSPASAARLARLRRAKLSDDERRATIYLAYRTSNTR